MNKILIAMLVLTAININSYGQELRPVKGKDNKWGFVDETGKEIIPFIYIDVGEFSEGLARVKNWGSLFWSFIDKTGKEIIPAKYFSAGDFSEGLARVEGINENWGSVDRNWGFIDKTGNKIIPFIYENVGDFSDGLARVNFNGKWGFINKTGNAVISFMYKDARDFSEGLAQVKLKHEWSYIDKSGKEVIKNPSTVNQNADKPDIAVNIDNDIVPEIIGSKQQNIPASILNVDSSNLTISSSPQKFKFGINGGLCYTNEVSKYDGKKSYSTNEYFPGFQLGFVGNVPLGKYFALQPSLLYAQQREVEKTGKEYEKRIINHLQVPVNVQVKLGSMPIWLQVGTSLGYALWGKYKWKEEVYEGQFESGSLDIKIGNNKADEFKPLDFGINSGIAMKVNNMQFGLNYNIGLVNKSTSDNKKVNEKSNGVSFSATYFWGK